MQQALTQEGAKVICAMSQSAKRSSKRLNYIEQNNAYLGSLLSVQRHSVELDTC